MATHTFSAICAAQGAMPNVAATSYQQPYQASNHSMVMPSSSTSWIPPALSQSSLCPPLAPCPQRPVRTITVCPCPVHVEEPLHYFCISCENGALCSECVLRTTDHSSHMSDILLIRKAFPVVKTRIAEIQAEAAKTIDNITLEENQTHVSWWLR
jgi:hypothetical protein